MKKWVKILIAAGVIILILAAIIGVIILNSQGAFAKGNEEQYSVAETQALSDSPIAGKRVIFLGSSVTYGSAAKGESFVDFLEKRDGIIPVKEAVSGTTLASRGEKDKNSYVRRIQKIDRSLQADAFICQLSTNDATKKVPLGKVSDSFIIEDFDTATVAGAIEYIIAYAKGTWNCPVAFYTGTQYNSRRYGEMVELLKQIAEKWDIYVINLWDDEVMNEVSKEDYSLYMVNGIHPSRAGYRDWWLPRFETYLYARLK